MPVVYKEAYLVSTNPPIRHVNSSYISGASTPTVLVTYNIPTFLVKFISTLVRIKGGTYMPGGIIAKGGLICQFIRVYRKRAAARDEA